HRPRHHHPAHAAGAPAGRARAHARRHQRRRPRPRAARRGHRARAGGSGAAVSGGREGAAMTVVCPALRYHGAKFRLSGWIQQFFPPHKRYVEPFGGAAGVLLQKPRAYAEIYNDLDGDVVNFFRVLRNPLARSRLIEQCTLTPYARAEFDEAWEPTTEPVERARRIAIRAQMGFGSAGASKGITGFRIDTRRAYGTAQQLWAEYPAAIAAAGERFT